MRCGFFGERMPSLAFFGRGFAAALFLILAAICCDSAMAQGLTSSVRALHIVTRDVAPEDVRARVRLAAGAGYNVLILTLADGVKFSSFPASLSTEAWSADALRGIVADARALGLDVVPEVKFLTHQELFLKAARADLMFNRVTSKPGHEQVQAIQRAHLDEVIRVIQPRAVHIGHDEVAGFSKASRKKWLESDEPTLPAELFEESVKWLHKELTTRGIEVWMWGDMLVAPDEFPGMYERHLHGLPPGYGKPLRDRLPKDIVICDWHYFDEQAEFPTVSVLRKEGFLVLGATWKRTETTRNFAAYAAAHGAQGMIATTWFHVQRKEWDVVDRIIRESGAIFAEHFPDKKN